MLTLDIERRFARVRPDATLLLRPKTGLKDMIVELDPGTPESGPLLEEGATLDSDATLPDVNFEEILASLDADTRTSLQLLVTDGGRALGDGGGRRSRTRSAASSRCRATARRRPGWWPSGARSCAG